MIDMLSSLSNKELHNLLLHAQAELMFRLSAYEKQAEEKSDGRNKPNTDT